MASQITKNKPMKMTLRRLLLAISLYTCRILRHRRHRHSGAATGTASGTVDSDGHAVVRNAICSDSRHSRRVRSHLYRAARDLG